MKLVNTTSKPLRLSITSVIDTVNFDSFSIEIFDKGESSFKTTGKVKLLGVMELDNKTFLLSTASDNIALWDEKIKVSDFTFDLTKPDSLSSIDSYTIEIVPGEKKPLVTKVAKI